MSRPLNPFVIDDNTPAAVETPVGKGRGLVPRDYATHPQGYSAVIPAWELGAMPLISRDEWIDRIREKWDNKTTLFHLRRDAVAAGEPLQALNQDGIGYCWFHSGTMATMLTYLKMGQPKRLSAFYGACQIKNFRDEGGWGAAGVEWIAKNGIPDISFWPEPVGNDAHKAMSRSNLTQAAKDNAALHKLTEGWADLEAAVYNRNMSWDQHITALLNDWPTASDYNWMGHSMCVHTACLGNPLKVKQHVQDRGVKLHKLDMADPLDAAVMADIINTIPTNSWTPQYGDQGDMVLSGRKAIPDGCVACRAATPSVN